MSTQPNVSLPVRSQGEGLKYIKSIDTIYACGFDTPYPLAGQNCLKQGGIPHRFPRRQFRIWMLSQEDTLVVENEER